MDKLTKKYYITTPIYYVNAKPHLGTLYSTLLADVLARWHKIQGYNTFFLTGTDEHGQKIAEAASKVSMQPRPFVDQFIDAFKNLWKEYHIDYSYFIRTTDPEHKTAVQQWLKKLIDQGDIYKAYYTGWYCTSCETFITEKDLENQQGIPKCPSCGRETKELSEESYFFRLSNYQEQLLTFYQEHPDFITPKERMQEVINFVKSGLKDLSISRTTISWGIPFPGDDKHVTYVWADALNNYITAIGYGDPKRAQEFNYWWPADVQVLGKDIVRFHAVYWPAFLMASGLAQPHKLLVHGWIKVGDQKMSKSLGNAIDPQQLLHEYGADAVRYYLARHMAITQDSSFSIEDLEERINADLAHELSNLLHRMIALSSKYHLLTVPAISKLTEAEIALRQQMLEMLESMQHEMSNCYINRAYNEAWKFIHQVNAYFHSQEPWKVAAQNPQRFAEIISATCHSLMALGFVIWPLMPEKMVELLAHLGVTLQPGTDYYGQLKSQPWNSSFVLSPGQPLFTRIEKKEEKAMQQKTQEVIEQIITEPDITIDDVVKVQLRVGTIEQVDEVPKSEKLYVLRVNFGDQGMRQICSGVRAHFKADELLGKQGVFVFNLQPRKMMGLESHGMMLFAENDAGKFEVVAPVNPVPNGTRLR